MRPPTSKPSRTGRAWSTPMVGDTVRSKRCPGVAGTYAGRQEGWHLIDRSDLPRYYAARVELVTCSE